MRSGLCRLVIGWVALVATCSALAAADLKLERGLAITDPDVLERLEKRSFSLTALLANDWRFDRRVTPQNNDVLSRMPAMEPVFSAVKREILATRTANPGSGVGMLFDHKRLFDQSYLSAADARFALVGIVQRLDRAYKQAATCGEVRMIYRLQYARDTANGPARSRLPMTFNLVFKAKLDQSDLTCREIAQRWVSAGQTTLTRDRLAQYLMSDNGPLSLVSPATIDRIETNLQILRRPSASISEFGGHAEYALKVFDWSAVNHRFQVTAMENMIDRERLLEDPQLLARFKSWLFTPDNVRALDDGTLLIPRDYLAIAGTSIAPGGAARSGNRPFFGLIGDNELPAIISRATSRDRPLKNILSPAGFQTRLNDITCVGCHQSRAIGGFHFMGADTAASRLHLAENAIFVPASAHFYGEAPRRRRVLDALARGKQSDYARGFSIRPSLALTRDRDPNPTMNIIGTGFFNGWGAACYANANNDASFRRWTCAAGLVCVKPHDNPADPGHGVCMSKGDLRTGDAVEYGQIRSQSFRDDRYVRMTPPPGAALKPPLVRIDVAKQKAAPQTGGFFGGMVYQKRCDPPVPSSTVCARTAGTAFNSCLATSKNFKSCFGEAHTDLVGLRECDKSMPCRDDYICIATADANSGACLPPYFMMQFRVDGHPN